MVGIWQASWLVLAALGAAAHLATRPVSFGPVSAALPHCRTAAPLTGPHRTLPTLPLQLRNGCLHDTSECLEPLMEVWSAQPVPVPAAPPPAACRAIVEALLANYSLKPQQSTGKVGPATLAPLLTHPVKVGLHKLFRARPNCFLCKRPFPRPHASLQLLPGAELAAVRAAEALATIGICADATAGLEDSPCK